MTPARQLLHNAATHAALLVTVCCYCQGAVIGVQEVSPENAGISDGACLPCRDRALSELRARR